MSFTKLDSGIVNSSIWSEPPATRVLWITLLSQSDEEGFVSTSVSGLKRSSNIDGEDFDIALKTLISPDPDSRTKDNEGIRLLVVEGGFFIVNYKLYRDRDYKERRKEQVREAVSRYREKKKVLSNHLNITSDCKVLPSASASASKSASSSVSASSSTSLKLNEAEVILIKGGVGGDEMPGPSGAIEDTDVAPAKKVVKKRDIEGDRLAFRNDVNNCDYPPKTLVSFFDYWSELNKSKVKMRFELQPTWELNKRLATWASREITLSNSKRFGKKDVSNDELQAQAERVVLE
jgi:hypothetical protein